MLPSILASQLEKGIGDYIETTFPMSNAPFKGSVAEMLAQKGSVYHEPYLAVRLPFRVAKEMPTCFEAIHPAYLPYVHQQKAFERLTGNDGRSTLIATGTGSGKTECFLYPILEYCYQHRGESGIKALIIYPMNALATDQSKRIAELIHNSPELRGNVTAGMYVGGLERTPSRTMSEHGIITDHETLWMSCIPLMVHKAPTLPACCAVSSAALASTMGICAVSAPLLPWVPRKTTVPSLIMPRRSLASHLNEMPSSPRIGSVPMSFLLDSRPHSLPCLPQIRLHSW